LPSTRPMAKPVSCDAVLGAQCSTRQSRALLT
jgi:hypothetical protein